MPTPLQTIDHVVPSAALRIDLAAEAALLESSASYKEILRSAKTLLKKADSRVVLIEMRAGAKIPAHKTGHSILLQTISGHVTLKLPTETADLPAKTMLFLDAGVFHDVVAKEDSTLLLIINWHLPGQPSASSRAPSVSKY